MTPERYLTLLPPEAVAAFAAATRSPLGTNRCLPVADRNAAELTRVFKPLVLDWARRLSDAVGFTVVRGFPIADDVSSARIAECYLEVGRLLGSIVPQNAQGDLVGRVKPAGTIPDDQVRGYQTSAALPFHTDASADVLGLMCYRPAEVGGISSLTSLHAIYNEILERDPELADQFFLSYPFDCRGEPHPDGGLYYERVLASNFNGRLVMRHNSSYIRSTARLPDAPRLTQLQARLLEVVDELSSSARFRFDFRLERGDLLLVDNYSLMHARSAFADSSDASDRELLRLWLILNDGPVLAPDFDNRGGFGRHRNGRACS